MAEELQHLIERIQREAVDTGEKEAARLVAQAREKAADLIKEAEEKAAALHRQAEQDAAQFMARSERALEQAARDILITVGSGVESLVRSLVRESADEALTPEVVQTMLLKLAEGFGANRDNRLEVLLNPAEQTRIAEHFRKTLSDKLREGVDLRPDSRVVKGFKVSMPDETAIHDFTREAIAEALMHFLRPPLSEIVHRVAREGGDPEGGKA